MSQETTDNFWKVLGNFHWPDPEPVFFRLYHDDQGRPIVYSMEHLDGPFVEVDRETYVVADFNVRVVDGQIVKIPRKIAVPKIIPSDDGIPCDPSDVCIVVNQTQPCVFWNLKQ